jgi:hypothetical protein
MADVRVVQGDTRPDVRATLTVTTTGLPLDLTSATEVRFQMRQDNDRSYTVNAPATIVDPRAEGKVRYSWGPNDLRQHGTYLAQWEITWAEGEVQTTTPANVIEVRRQ